MLAYRKPKTSTFYSVRKMCDGKTVIFSIYKMVKNFYLLKHVHKVEKI